MAAIASDLLVRDKLYIGGEWVEPSGQGTIDVINPTTEEVLGRIPEGDADDADRAVRAARAAFDSWSRRAPHERAGFAAAIGAKLAERGDELGVLFTTELGMPLTLSRMIQAGLPTVTFSSQAELVEEIEWEEEVGNSLIVREPAGVVAAITPWNYPLSQVANKVAPALAAGCTVVLKPSEVVPLSAFVLAEIFDQVGSAGGGVQPGHGRPARWWARRSPVHPETDMVSFTGSTRAGKRIGELAAQAVKPVSLELGGKSRERDPRRRGPRAGGHRRRGQVLPQLGTDLQRAHAHARPAREARGGGEDRRRGGGVVHAGRPVHRGDDARAARLRDPARARAWPTSRRARRRAPAGDGRRRGARGAGGASSCGPRSSPTSRPR